MMNSAARLPAALLFASLIFIACDEEKPPTEQETPTAPAGNEPAPAAAPGAAKPKGESPLGNKGASAAACLAGKWHYDFADDALETMMANLPKAKVTKEEGELICKNVLTGSEGTVTCSTAGGKPVAIDVTADQAGMPLTLKVKMSGKTTSKFKLIDDTTMQMTSEGMGDLNVEVEATIAGNKIPFPAMEMLEAFGGEQGATSSFKCSGDELQLRPQIEGKTSWQKLQRIK